MRNYGSVQKSVTDEHMLYDGAPSRLCSSDSTLLHRGDERKASRFYLFLRVSLAMLLIIAASVATTSYYSHGSQSHISASPSITKFSPSSEALDIVVKDAAKQNEVMATTDSEQGDMRDKIANPLSSVSKVIAQPDSDLPPIENAKDSNPDTEVRSPAARAADSLDIAAPAASSITDSTDQLTDSTGYQKVLGQPDDPYELYGVGADKIELSSLNEYGLLRPNYPWLSPLSAILFEPYKVMTVNAHGFELADGDRYKWVLRHFSKDALIVAENVTEAPVAYFKHEGTANLKLEFHVLNADDELKMKKVFVVYTKYVKREMRNLTVEDREKFLNTAIELWKTSTSQGREKYGDMYTGIDTYVLEHAIASNDILCDQFHEGSGFLTHHMALQASFDASLKSIDPSVVLPYWDFTKEGEAIMNSEKNPDYFMEISPFLSDEWFGAVDEKGHIINSRWKGIKFPITDGEGRVKPNSYGMIRSYWNNNNDAYITRFPFNVAGQVVKNKRIPNCATQFDVLNTTTLGAFQLLSPAYGHGPMHVQMGGISGPVIEDLEDFRQRWASVLLSEYTDDELQNMGLSPDHVRLYDEKYPLNGVFNYKVVGEFFHIYRSLWRSHMCARDSTVQLLHCPEKCGANTPLSDCKCSIPMLKTGETDWENVYHCIVFNEALRAKFDKIYPQELLKDMVNLFAETQLMEGEMLEAASPADPLFWMIHPVINRLEHAKRLDNIQQMGGMPFHKWSNEEETWLAYSYYNFDAGEKPGLPDGNYCPGHAATDPVLPDALPLSRGFHQRVDKNADGVITNFEFYMGTDPNDPDKLEYVFDSFDWPHCTEEGIMRARSITDLLD